jgi:hypothetical protein
MEKKEAKRRSKMTKRLVVLLTTVTLLLGTSGIAAAYEYEFETRGTRDYPPRIAGFVLFPVGLVLDWVFFRPVSYLACSVPDFTGCEPEEQRSLGMEKLDRELPSEPTR